MNRTREPRPLRHGGFGDIKSEGQDYETIRVLTWAIVIATNITPPPLRPPSFHYTFDCTFVWTSHVIPVFISSMHIVRS